MKDDNVPISYLISRISYQSEYIFKILYSIFGSFAFILILKLLKYKRKYDILDMR